MAPTPLRVLIVDDSADDALLIARELRRGGFDVDALRVDAPSALLAAFDRQPWDAIVADYSLPRLPAPALLRLLRERQADVPVLVVSGKAGEETAVEVMRAGARDFISKERLARLPEAVRRELVEARLRLERRQVEDALQSVRERFRLVAENSPDAIFVIDAASMIQFANGAAESIFGYPAEDLNERCISLIIPERLRQKHLDAVARLVRTGKPSLPSWRNIEVPGLHRDGHEVPLELSYGRFTDGGRQFFVGIVRDVTERKRSEEEWARLEEQFAESQRLEAVGRLAGGVAHDFGNQLTVIGGYCRLLLNDRQLAGGQREQVEEILKAAQRSNAIASQLLAFSRRQVLAPEALDINQVVIEMSGALRSLLGETIELRLAPAEGPAVARIDRAQLEQAVLNIVANARDAMPSGGTLTVRTGQCRIDERTPEMQAGSPPGRYATLSIADTGSGMDEETRRRMFDPYFTTKVRGKGTGLGLAMVYGFVKQSQGFIRVESERGRGTTLMLLFPSVEDSPSATALPSAPEYAVPAGRGTVLVVEDEESVRSIVVRALTRTGYVVLEATGGDEALRLAERYVGTIDLLLADVVMPKRSGPETAARLATMRPETRVLFMSGYPEETIFERGELPHGASYLSKPFTLEALTQRVRQVLTAEPGKTPQRQ